MHVGALRAATLTDPDSSRKPVPAEYLPWQNFGIKNSRIKSIFVFFQMRGSEVFGGSQDHPVAAGYSAIQLAWKPAAMAWMASPFCNM